ncbi:MAG: hypothetical protein KDA28_15145 [Phycisphaerales bacterium]|nr:hypothetical protein [Phycisphaerales bacterium]
MTEAPRALPQEVPDPPRAQASQQARPAPPAPKPKPKKMQLAYGINDCIKLMRTLPDADIEIVVEVVKKTLESTEIKVTDIIRHAEEKENDIEQRIGTLESEIRDLQAEIARRNQEIAEQQADLKETRMVHERLELAERRAGGGVEEPGPAMARSSGASSPVQAAHASQSGEATIE